jgi:hypothetical protein
VGESTVAEHVRVAGIHLERSIEVEHRGAVFHSLTSLGAELLGAQ